MRYSAVVKTLRGARKWGFNTLTRWKRILCAALCLCVLCGIAVVGASAASESFGFSLQLGSAANCRSYGGNNISTFNPQNADKDRGSYEGGTVEVTNNGTTIHLKERKNFKNAYYLLLPFTMTVEVPAYTCYKVTLSYDIKLQRNAKGESWYVMEWTDNTDGAAYKRTYSANNADASGGICRLHSSAKSPCTGSGTVELTFDNLNGSAQKSMTREYAIFVGNSQSNSLLTAYHHQLETTFTLSKKSCTTTKTVRLNANGGKVSPASKVVTCGSTYGTLPTPTRTGYDFDGWYTQKTDGTKVNNTISVGTNPPTTLYAHWKGQECTVTLDANGGTVSMASRTATYGSKYPALPAPTRTGYTFDGWYTQKTDGTKVDDNTTVTTAANHTLYAHWHLTPAQAPKNVTLTMNPTTGDYGERIFHKVHVESNTAHTKETTWYACDENGDNGIPITDENGDPTYPKTPTAGVHYYYVLVTATRKDNGLQASTKSNVVCVTVTKATPTITTKPTAAELDLVKGNTLAASALTGGTAKNNKARPSVTVAGHFVWKDATVKPSRNGGYYAVVFQPDDTQNYEPTETTVYVNVTCSHRFGDWNAGRRTCTVCGEEDVRTNTVTVTWGELAYTYTDGAWNPATHDYDIGGGWAPNRKNGDVITVQNEGANEVRVKFQYTRTDTAIGGSFAKSDGDYLYSPIDLPVNRTKTVRLCLTGRPGKTLNNAKIGSVTVRLEGGY
jgi:uncharacterized repeat protein (TIGR02543 family)